MPDLDPSFDRLINQHADRVLQGVNPGYGPSQASRGNLNMGYGPSDNTRTGIPLPSEASAMRFESRQRGGPGSSLEGSGGTGGYPGMTEIPMAEGGEIKPTHMYEVAEEAPEEVTAHGLYIPFEDGEVIAHKGKKKIKSRKKGGKVREGIPVYSMKEGGDVEEAWTRQQKQAQSMIEPFGAGAPEKRTAVAGPLIKPEVTRAVGRAVIDPEWHEKMGLTEPISKTTSTVAPEPKNVSEIYKGAGIPGGYFDYPASGEEARPTSKSETEMDTLRRGMTIETPTAKTMAGDETARNRIYGETAPGGYSSGPGGRVGLPEKEEFVPNQSFGLGGSREGTLGVWKGGAKSLAEHEKELYGGLEPPGEFDWASAAKKAGSVTKSPKTQFAIMKEMFTEHGQKTRAFEDMRKAREMYGEGSAHMITAKADASYKEAEAKLAAAKLPMDIYKGVAEAAHYYAEAQGAKDRASYYKAYANFMESKIKSSQDMQIFKVLKEQLDKAPFGTEKETVERMNSFVANILERDKIDQQISTFSGQTGIPMEQ